MFDKRRGRLTYKAALQHLLPVLEQVLTLNPRDRRLQPAQFDLDTLYMWIIKQTHLDLPRI